MADILAAHADTTAYPGGMQVPEVRTARDAHGYSLRPAPPPQPWPWPPRQGLAYAIQFENRQAAAAPPATKAAAD